MNTVRIASVPANHVYVRHLSADDGTAQAIRLPDPEPADGRTVPGGWWPPLMLDPHWISEHHAEFDVFHIHFGFDAIAPARMAQVLAELRTHGKPLVYTLHDLRNPHQPDPALHAELLDVIASAADRVITLTPGAADEARERWGIDPVVLPHPHVVERRWLERTRPERDNFLVGVHAKSLRANMDPLPLLEVLADAIVDLPGARLQIDLHDEMLDPSNHWYAPDRVRDLLAFDTRPQVQTRMHHYFSDDELWDYLWSLSASVLPYRFGTHSGWLEACHDLGTAVIAPSCGFYSEQRPIHSFTFDEDRFDADSLVTALKSAYAEPLRRPTWEERYAERALLSTAHDAIYQELRG